ncbi:hypothetical protein VB711_08535 [Cronbergia sp. UHCC 0137]|uniref:hypothetical protein n=1 Tax=Cronbergia sp. UHCC 0137 TaxID=3110239 RepID=UPI002B216305|nr:hypothetical protein [Cronbergia sp. UHCC 0137]MEA5617883.1 hypothetical protein [Cronbergia sp. UHCC 0137]
MENIKSKIQYYLRVHHHIEINFFILDSRVYTKKSINIKEELILNMEEGLETDTLLQIGINSDIMSTLTDTDNEENLIIIEIECDLQSYSSHTEIFEKARPRYLTILSILSFFTGEVFTVSQKMYTQLMLGNIYENNQINTLFINNGINKTEDLSKLIDFINSSDKHNRMLIYSLLDRWRKGLYLQEESEDTFLYNDEALLAYYHILELLSSVYESPLKKDVDELCSNFLDKLLGDTYHLSKKILENEKLNKSKSLKDLLISEISIKIKIYYMLNKLKMLNNKSKEIVEKLINDRNAVAHGRAVYQDNVIFPVPPFFPLVEDLFNEIEIAKIISARAIASHLGLNTWKKEWTNLLRNFRVPYEVVQAFIENKYYLNISSEDFINGKKHKVRPSDIYYYTVTRKIKLKKLEEIICQIIIDTEINEINALEFSGISILLSDSKNYVLCQKCRQIIKTSYDKNWISHSEFRDMFLYLEYKKFNINTIKNLLYTE